MVEERAVLVVLEVLVVEPLAAEGEDKEEVDQEMAYPTMVVELVGVEVDLAELEEQEDMEVQGDMEVLEVMEDKDQEIMD